MWRIPALKELKETLQDPSSPVGKRMRAAYYCKQLFVNHSKGEEKEDEQDDIVNLLCSQVLVQEHGSLLRHEFAYVLGQMQTPKSCCTLENILREEDDCVMVRHEAAEALGGIASPSSRQALQDTYNKNKGSLDELADTCRLALNRIDHPDDQQAVGCACMLQPYNSVDPASPDPEHEHLSTQELGDMLLNDQLDLIERYRAMFSLRNRGSEDAVQQLCRALLEDTSSPLLRHEVAFVLGQLQHPSSIAALSQSLQRSNEHAMVRHESAEALGAIDGGTSEDWNRIVQILTKYQQDPVLPVAESCIVALDAADYWGYNNDSQQDEVSPTFGQQKNESPSQDAIRKDILAQHFNVRTTTAC
jgi:deoxyhypusine monooxygenase